jgi:hypothetical protein
MDTETRALVQRWILAFCEMPILVDKELMRRVLADVEQKPGTAFDAEESESGRQGQLGSQPG